MGFSGGSSNLYLLRGSEVRSDQGHLDFVEHDVNAATIKLLGQVSDRKANAGRFHGDFSELFLPCQLRSRR